MCPFSFTPISHLITRQVPDHSTFCNLLRTADHPGPTLIRQIPSISSSAEASYEVKGKKELTGKKAPRFVFKKGRKPFLSSAISSDQAVSWNASMSSLSAKTLSISSSGTHKRESNGSRWVGSDQGPLGCG